MRQNKMRLAVAVALAGMSVAPAVWAEESMKKALPTLLIKGEVVSADTTDPAATLLKVKDRYGFETPIYLAQETKILQGDASMNVSNLIAGTAVEVEYNFDINTAKRHAVSVKLAAPAAAEPAAAPASPAEGTPAPAAAPEMTAPMAEPAPEMPAEVAPESDEPSPQEVPPADQ